MSFEIQFEKLSPARWKEALIGLIPWDCETFGFNVADLRVPVSLSTSVGAEEFRQCIEEWVKENQVELVAASVPASDTQRIGWLQKAGFTFVDSTLSLVYEKLRADRLPNYGIVLRKAVPNDQHQIESLAGTMFAHGRYHNDPCFPKDLADKRYENWISRVFMPSSGQEILLNDHPEGIRGFSVIQINDDHQAYFHLMGVAKRWQGTILPIGLLSSTLLHFIEHDVRKIHSKISASNVKILNLHAFHGARYKECDVLLHWHRPDAKIFVDYLGTGSPTGVEDETKPVA